MPDDVHSHSSHRVRLTRRQALALAGTCALGGGLAGAAITWKRHERGQRAATFIGRAASYNANLTALITAGLNELGVTRAAIRNKRVLLKPNLVETAAGIAHINTNPQVVLAAAEAFRKLDAAEVSVAEGQGHRRDSWLVLDESGMGAALHEAGLPFTDLNHDDVKPITNRGEWTKLDRLHLPRTLLAADVIVSLPKLKTHHWAGMTCAMKNLFGVMPGIVYGWPKNVLHWQGIHNSILDINATVQPHLAIVDGIVGMDGDGPIMGNAKLCGALVIGRNLPAVDATCARLMCLKPAAIEYLAAASGKLGPILARNIEQRGEPIAALQTPFELLDVPHLRKLR